MKMGLLLGLGVLGAGILLAGNKQSGEQSVTLPQGGGGFMFPNYLASGSGEGISSGSAPYIDARSFVFEAPKSLLPSGSVFSVPTFGESVLAASAPSGSSTKKQVSGTSVSTGAGVVSTGMGYNLSKPIDYSPLSPSPIQLKAGESVKANDLSGLFSPTKKESATVVNPYANLFKK